MSVINLLVVTDRKLYKSTHFTNSMEYKNKVVDNLKQHVVDSTALLAESTPVFAAFEVGIAGMSDATSMNARMLAAGIAYAGVGYLFGKGRDLSRKVFKITDQTKERTQHIHDVGYTAAFNLAISPPMYAISQTLAGEDIDLTKIAIGTAAATAFGAVNGSPMGYAVDVFRDLSGVRECNRPSYPKFLKKQSAKVKKGILAGLIGASIGVAGLIYSMTPNTEPQTAYQEKPAIEQRVDSLDYRQAGQNLESLTQELYSDK